MPTIMADYPSHCDSAMRSSQSPSRARSAALSALRSGSAARRVTAAAAGPVTAAVLWSVRMVAQTDSHAVSASVSSRSSSAWPMRVNTTPVPPATVISMYPLALLAAAVAIVALRTRALPRWLGYGSAVTAAALAVNAGFLYATIAPAFLLFILWTLAASVTLFVKARSQAVHLTPRPAPVAS